MDGKLHRFALSTDATSLVADGAPVDVIPAYSAFPAPGARPAMVVGWGRAYVSDPRDGTVKVVTIEGAAAMAIEKTIAVGGAPSSLALTSISPDWENH
jgi:hypothetical protein